MELNSKLSTTRNLWQTNERNILNHLDEFKTLKDQFETILFLPKTASRKGKGGLRTKGYFKSRNSKKPLITIITVVYNNQENIEETILSVINQSYDNIEYLIIDGGSSDNTVDIIKKYNNSIDYWISEKDNGIYDAINKGIKLAEGEIISILHSDDIYYDNQTLLRVVEIFEEKKIDIVYGDLLYVSKNNLNKIIRYWRSNQFRQNLFEKGWSPPHPSFFVKKRIHNKFGYYNTKIGNSADIELMYKFLELKKVNSMHISKVLIKMRYGGKSNNNIIEIIKQNIQILKFLNLKSPIKIIKFIYFKIIDRVLQFIKKYK